MKKNTNIIFGHLELINIVIMTAALLCVGIVSETISRIAVSSSTLLLVGSLYVIRCLHERRSFGNLVYTKLTKAGLKYSVEEDGILVKQGDVAIKARFWGRSDDGLRRVHFMFNFAPQSLNQVQPEGWSILASECNAYYDHTTMKFYGDHFSCVVETSVKSAKDFVEEYRFAYAKINETLQGMAANTERVTSQYPAVKKQVGFVIPERQ